MMYGWFLRYGVWQTDRQTDRQMDRQTDRRPDRWTDRQNRSIWMHPDRQKKWHREVGAQSKNNLTIAVNVLNAKNQKIYPAYISKLNSKSEKQAILLMITTTKRWYYLAVKNICVIKRNNIKTWWRFSLFELPSFA